MDLGIGIPPVPCRAWALPCHDWMRKQGCSELRLGQVTYGFLQEGTEVVLGTLC